MNELLKLLDTEELPVLKKAYANFKGITDYRKVRKSEIAGWLASFQGRKEEVLELASSYGVGVVIKPLTLYKKAYAVFSSTPNYQTIRKEEIVNWINSRNLTPAETKELVKNLAAAYVKPKLKKNKKGSSLFVISARSREFKDKIHTYILDSIDGEPYGKELSTIKDKIQFVMDTYYAEGYVRKAHKQTSFITWLKGLPAAMNVEFEYAEILKLGIEWLGPMDRKAENAWLHRDYYWTQLYFGFNRLCSQHEVSWDRN